MQENKSANICGFISLPNTGCSGPRGLGQGSSQPKLSHRSTESELGHLLSFQNQCKLGILPALGFQHPAGKQPGRHNIKLFDKARLQQFSCSSEQLLYKISQNNSVFVSAAVDFHTPMNGSETSQIHGLFPLAQCWKTHPESWCAPQGGLAHSRDSIIPSI